MTVIYSNKMGEGIRERTVTPASEKVHSKNDCRGCGDIMGPGEQTPEIPGYCPVCVSKMLTKRMPMDGKKK